MALSATGDAVLLYRGNYPGYVFSKYRPAGGSWGGAVEVIVHNYPDTMQGLMVEFDGLGRTVALAEFREFVDTVRVNVGTGGGWGPKDQVLDDRGHPRRAEPRRARTAPAGSGGRLDAALDVEQLQRRRPRLAAERHLGHAEGLRRPEPLHHAVGRDQRDGRDPRRRRAQPRRADGRGRRHPRRGRAIAHRRVGRHDPDLARGHERRHLSGSPRGRRRFRVLRRLGRARHRELADGDRLDQAARDVRRHPTPTPTATRCDTRRDRDARPGAESAPRSLAVAERHTGPARVPPATPSAIADFTTLPAATSA